MILTHKLLIHFICSFGRYLRCLQSEIFLPSWGLQSELELDMTQVVMQRNKASVKIKQEVD